MSDDGAADQETVERGNVRIRGAIDGRQATSYYNPETHGRRYHSDGGSAADGGSGNAAGSLGAVGETVAGTAADDFGELRTEAVPTGVDLDALTETQQRVIEAYFTNPAASQQTIADELGVTTNTVTNALDQAGIDPDWGERAARRGDYAAAARFSDDPVDALFERERRTIETAVEHPDWPQTQIVEAVDWAPSEVSKLLRDVGVPHPSRNVSDLTPEEFAERYPDPDPFIRRLKGLRGVLDADGDGGDDADVDEPETDERDADEEADDAESDAEGEADATPADDTEPTQTGLTALFDAESVSDAALPPIDEVVPDEYADAVADLTEARRRAVLAYFAHPTAAKQTVADAADVSTTTVETALDDLGADPDWGERALERGDLRAAAAIMDERPPAVVAREKEVIETALEHPDWEQAEIAEAIDGDIVSGTVSNIFARYDVPHPTRNVSDLTPEEFAERYPDPEPFLERVDAAGDPNASDADSEGATADEAAAADTDEDPFVRAARGRAARDDADDDPGETESDDDTAGDWAPDEAALEAETVCAHRRIDAVRDACETVLAVHADDDVARFARHVLDLLDSDDDAAENGGEA